MKVYDVYPLAVVFLLHANAIYGEPVTCEVRARIESGWVCGRRRYGDNNKVYASFRGVPYAKQPLGQLRFKELQPAEPWDYLDASEEGPICPQTDVFYGKLMTSQKMDEACIYANIHVPIDALPQYNQRRPPRDLKPPYETARSDENDQKKETGLPILVFVHGGGFAFGSGDTDLYGPEYLMNKDLIVITFNYRLNALGFLSLNTPSIPGNNGLRDIVTLLRWVRANARHFGGNPDQVTLGGQSAGSSAAHLVSLSPQAAGLFQRLILMSGTAFPTFFTLSPGYAQFVANIFLKHLNINATDPEEVHRQLIEVPIEKIIDANSFLIKQFGVTTFFPVIESKLPGVTPIVTRDPELLISKGVGNNITLLIGFTTAECESFRPRFEQIDLLKRIKENPLLMLSPDVTFNAPPGDLRALAKRVEDKYFNGMPSMDKYVESCSDNYYIYPALKLAKVRQAAGGAPVYLYQFSFEGDNNVIKAAKGIQYKGVAHVEDMTYVFKANSILETQTPFPPSHKDDFMKERMISTVQNYVYCSHPTCINTDIRAWLPVDSYLRYQDLEDPLYFRTTEPSDSQIEMMEFFDSIYNRSTV